MKKYIVLALLTATTLYAQTPPPFVVSTNVEVKPYIATTVFSKATVDAVIGGLIDGGFSSPVKFSSTNLMSFRVMRNATDTNFTCDVRLMPVIERAAVPTNAVDSTHFTALTNTVTTLTVQPYTLTPDQIDSVINGLISAGYSADIRFSSANLEVFKLTRRPDGLFQVDVVLKF